MSVEGPDLMAMFKGLVAAQVVLATGCADSEALDAVQVQVGRAAHKAVSAETSMTIVFNAIAEVRAKT